MALEKVTIDESVRVVQEWRKDNKDMKVPQFAVYTAVRKWGQIQTEVISLECVREQAQYMKHIISAAVEQKCLDGCLFVPIGIHLMKSSDVLSNLLRQHNQTIAALIWLPILIPFGIISEPSDP